MEKKNIVLIFLILLSFGGYAQELNYFYVDSATYSQYLNSDWKALSKLGRKSNRNGIKFYNLNLRLGTAFYERGKYLKAIPYFEKALKVQPDYEYTQKHLLAAYNLSGFENMAFFIQNDMSENTLNELELSNNFVRSVDFEFSYSPNLDFDSILNINYLDTANSNVLSYSYLEKSSTNYNVGVNFQLSRDVFLYQKFEYFLDDYILKKESIFNNNFNQYLQTKQLRYYGKLSYYMQKRWMLNFNYNFISGQYEDVDENILLSSFPTNSIISQSVNYNLFSTGLSIYKNWAWGAIKPNINFIHTFDKDYCYAGTDFTLYPLRNKDFFVTASASYSLFDSKNFIRPNLNFSSGFRIWKFNFYGSYYLGRIKNYVENDGYFIYNFAETITNQYGGGITFMSKQADIIISGLYSENEYKYVNFPENYGDPVTNSNTFNKILIKGGIKWKF